MDLEKELFGVAGTALGLALGSLLVAFKDDLQAGVLSILSGRNKYLKGTWTCDWVVTAGAEQPNTVTINDQVTVDKVGGRLFKGTGVAQGFGGYKVEGKVEDHVIVANYKGDGANKGLAGVVILKIESDSYLHGVWSQYTEKGVLKGGSVEWKKAG
jgi:hypothetical protein